MNLAFQTKAQKKTLILAVAAAGVVLVVAATFLIKTIMMSNPASKSSNISQSAQLENLKQSQEKLQQTLEQEKHDRARVHEVFDASNNYQKLAQ